MKNYKNQIKRPVAIQRDKEKNRSPEGVNAEERGEWFHITLQ